MLGLTITKSLRLVVATTLIMAGYMSFAATEPEIKDYADCDTMDVDSSIVIFDNLSFDQDGNKSGTYWTHGYKHYSIRNTAYLEINEYLDSCFLDTFSFWVDLEVSRKDTSNTLVTDTIRLKVNYDTSLSVFNNETASYVFENGLWSKARILAMSDASLKKYVKIGQTLIIERYRTLDQTTDIDLNTVVVVPGTEEVRFSWNPIDGAESYQLEWTWVDAFDNSGTGTLSSALNVQVNFRNDATRVNIDSTHYSISAAFEAGYLVARVRAVGVNKHKKEQVVFGDWSNNGYLSSLSSYTLNKEYVQIMTGNSITPLDEEMNWQYASSFSEGGKRSEMITYYDGSLRNRQSVTRISTIMQAVVGETVYDYEGRSAVNILPVPAFDQTLRFHPGFNLSNETGKPYDKNDFDSAVVSLCEVNIAGLKNTSGASKYYSPENDSASSRSFGFIPDAHGYPMNVTEYAADGSGRVKRQSGVGKTHQLGSGHETWYYFSTPGEQELDRLFGNAVGAEVHYQKGMVVDANGQVTVSYRDLSGKVIATSLAGNAPDSMTKLGSEANANDTLLQHLPSDYLPNSGLIRTNKVFTVSSDNSLHMFEYKLEIPRHSEDSFPELCFDCVYELEISLMDDCEQQMLDGDPNTAGNQPIIRMVGMAGVDFDVSCDSSVLTYNFELDTLIDTTKVLAYLNIGRYTLSKTLRISENAYEYYWEKVKQDPNIKTLEDFEAEAIAEQDTMSCFYTCQECFDSLGQFNDYQSTRSVELSNLGYTLDQIDELVRAEWDAKVAQCSTYCLEPETTCENIYNTLLMDVMPGGQYFPIPDTATGTIPSTGIFDLTGSNVIGFNYKQFDSSGTWYDHVYWDRNGDTIKVNAGLNSVLVNNLTVDQYYEMHDIQWAKNIVRHHPEYCIYEFCKDNETAYEYNDSMYAVRTFREAYKNGFIDPLNDPLINAPVYEDPFFSDPGNSSHKTTFTNQLDQYSLYGISVGNNCGPYSVLELALLINYSDGNFNNCGEVDAWLNNYLPIDTTQLCDERADAMWNTIRGIYISEKEQYFNNSVKCSPTIPTGYVARFGSMSDLIDDSGVDDSETDKDVVANDRIAVTIEKCDTLCLNQADYWLNQLGGCNLPDSIQDTLIVAFTNICRNSCGADHPWGARSYPTSATPRFSVPYDAHSFAEAFDSIVPAELKALEACDPWLISYPLSYNRTLTKLAGVDTSCIKDLLDNDTCYSTASDDMQEYILLTSLQDTSFDCEDCIECEDLQLAWDSLADHYGGVFIDSTWNLKEIMTNFFNSYFGFNLNYWDYKDFAEECYSFGNVADATDGVVSVDQPSVWDLYTPQLSPFEERKRRGNLTYTNMEYASSNPDDFFPFMMTTTTSQSSGDWFVDTCICNQLASYLSDFGQTNQPAMDSILNGTADYKTYDKFEDFLASSPRNCIENVDTSLSDLTKALIACLNVYKEMEGTDLVPGAEWSEFSYEMLNTYVANESLTIGADTTCFGPCPAEHPVEDNDFFDPVYSDPAPVFTWPGYTPCTTCPNCDSLEVTMNQVLYDNFGMDTTVNNSEWQSYKSCFFSSICEVMSPGNEWLCQNCEPDDTIGNNGYPIEAIYDSLWNTFSDKYSTYWETTMMLRATGIQQGDSLVPSEDTLDPKEKMKLLMTMYGKCIYIPCNYCYPECPEGDTCIAEEPDITCCKDTTIYFTKLQAFLEDFLDSKGFLGNHFPYPRWGAYPQNVNYYSSPFYEGTCHKDIKYRMIKNRMPVLNFVMEDGCNDKFYVNLGYLRNYLNQANYGKIFEILDIMILPEPEPVSCIGTNRFAILANQWDKNGDTIRVELIGSISKYELYTARVTYGQSCEGPKLCNRAFGIQERNYLDPCVSEKLMRAHSLAKIRYDNYLDTLEQGFRARYRAKCMTAVDSLSMDYELKEYHYTLYYYDQVGNLTQTVPPKGVNLITSKNDLSQIQRYRTEGTGSAIYASHSLTTRYQYNTLNQIRWQNTPDGGTSDFWYDRLGRLAVSQNAEQKDGSNDNYSYTLYDSLGRITEVGQIHSTTPVTTSTVFDEVLLSTWISNGVKAQVTRTWYDASPVDLSSEGFNHGNLRGRIAALAVYESGSSNYDHAVFYRYGIHGNVEGLIREIPELHFIEQGYKTISYDYDLVSGNLKNVYYQREDYDQFIHSYSYDADNRVEDVRTSSNGVHWNRDAHYSYYWHGPVRRKLIGDLNVQGLDYAYTIYGWLKGVNSNSLDASRDIGQDGHTSGHNQLVARDVFGYSLHYFNADYDPINEMHSSSPTSHFLMKDSGSTFKSSVRELFNGNISRMVTALGQLSNTIIGKSYEYDQLHRLSASHTFNNYIRASNSWLNTSGGDENETEYTYDDNGNILTLRRSNANGDNIDSLTYHYITGTNQLEYVDDGILASAFTYDVDDQSNGNYTYDKIGNLISDVSEEISNIEWTVYGKIKSVTRTANSNKPNLSFEYSPDGYRVAKHVTDSLGNTTSTWYVRDVAGNILATYNRTWDVELDTSGLNADAMYNQLKLDKTFESLLTFFDSEFEWKNYTQAMVMNQLESDINMTVPQQHDFLKLFDGLQSMSDSVYNGIMSTISDTALVSVLRTSYQDAQLTEFLCDSCAEDLFVAMMDEDYQLFLNELNAADPGLFDALCDSFGIPLFLPLQDRITALSSIASSTVAPKLVNNGNYDCTMMATILDNMVTFNTNDAKDFFATLPDFQGCITKTIDTAQVKTALSTYYGNDWIWEQIFFFEPSTESSKVADLKTSNKRGFIHNAVKELGQGTMDYVVTHMSYSGVGHWLESIKAHYGLSYYTSFVQSFIKNNNLSYWSFALQEHHIYGSDRLGVQLRNLKRYEQIREEGTSNYVSTEGDSLIKYTYQDSIKFNKRGATYYELNNHLGNVLATITDRRIQTCGTGEVLYYSAQVVTISDYYPFGMEMDDRKVVNTGKGYRFGFNGKEVDREDLGSGGTTYDYGFRIYNPGMARFLSVDPLSSAYPWYTPYQFAGNSPIAFIDLDGLERVDSEETRTDPGKVKLGKEVDKVFKKAQKRYNKAETEEEKLNIVEETFEEVVKQARDHGFEYSADFLEVWLNENNSGTKTVDAYWLFRLTNVGKKGYKRAEKMVFEGPPKGKKQYSTRKGIVKELIGKEFEEGQTIQITDNWDALATHGNKVQGGDEFYTLGDFTVHADADFKATRDGDYITAVGTVTYTVVDDYGFDKGKKVRIMGYTVYDDWGKTLEEAGRAKGYSVTGTMTISYEIKINVKTGEYEVIKADITDVDTTYQINPDTTFDYNDY